MTKPFHWGILGSGKISAKFAEGLGGLKSAQIEAVAARDLERAKSFVSEHKANKAYGSYEELVSDPNVDVVYIGTVNTAHRDNILLCLNAGKAVLCEKPFTLNASEAEEVAAVAREKNLFLMEAMWTRFFPVIEKVREWITDGRIGQVRMVQATFGHPSGTDPKGRLLNPELGGGSLLDVGIYPLSFAAMVYGAMPTENEAIAHFGETGVDEDAAMLLKFPCGGLAVLASSVCTRTDHNAYICGTKGRIKVETPFWHPTQAAILQDETEIESFSEPYLVNGFEYEATAVMDCLQKGLTECPVMPLDESIALMRLMDSIRGKWSLKYPGE